MASRQPTVQSAQLAHALANNGAAESKARYAANRIGIQEMMFSSAGRLVALAKQFSLFTVIGALGTLIHYLVMWISIGFFGAAPIIATISGSIFGAIVNYALNKRHTFTSARAHKEALPRFLAVAALGMVINAMTVWSATSLWLWHYWFAQFLATGMVLITGFFINRFWTFREEPP